jgi:hypothetical protein
MDRNDRQDDEREYTSPKHAVIWCLKRSRRTLRKKCARLKDEQKRLSNSVRDVTKSREMWASRAKAEAARAKELEAELVVMKKEVADLKKGVSPRRQ